MNTEVPSFENIKQERYCTSKVVFHNGYWYGGFLMPEDLTIDIGLLIINSKLLRVANSQFISVVSYNNKPPYAAYESHMHYFNPFSVAVEENKILDFTDEMHIVQMCECEMIRNAPEGSFVDCWPHNPVDVILVSEFNPL